MRAEVISLMGQRRENGEEDDGCDYERRECCEGGLLGKVGFEKVEEWNAEKSDGRGLETVFVFSVLLVSPNPLLRLV